METQSGKSSMWEMLQDKKLISPTNKLLNVQKRVQEGELTNRKGFRDICGSNFVQIFFNVHLHNIRKCARMFVAQGVSVLEGGWLAWCCVRKIPMVGGILSLFFKHKPKCVRLAEIAHSLLKLAPYDTQTMESRGLRRYIMEMLPITDWSAEAVRPALILILKRLDRMFNKIHKMPTLRWGGLLIHCRYCKPQISSLSVFKVVDQSRVEGMAQKCSIGYMCRANQDMNA